MSLTKVSYSMILGASANVLDFGAAGDGVTNDTVAIQAALNAGAGNVYFPQGTYSVAQLTVPNGVRFIYGPGVLKQRTAGANVLYLSGVSDIIIDGIKILGVAGTNEGAAASSNNGIFCTGGCYNVTVRNCRVDRMLYYPVYMEDTYDSRIEGCFFFQNALGPRLRGCRRVIIANNEVRQTCLASSVFTVGIGLDSTDGHALGFCRDIVIEGNHVTGFENAQGLLVHAGVRVTIANNIIQESAMGVSCNPFNATDDIANVAIDGNVIQAYSGTWTFGAIGNTCIVVQGGPGTPDPTQVVISDNSCLDGNRSLQGANEGAIRIGYTTKTIVSGNTISFPYANGIVCTDSEEQVVIANNVITGVTAASAQENGIFFLAASKACVSTNYIEGAQYGIELITSSQITLNGNQYENCAQTITGGQHVIDRSKTVTSGTTVDLGDVDNVYFNYAAPTTVTTWTNVIPGRLYTFFFFNGNVTIDRSNSYLNGGVNITTSANDVVLMLGRPTNVLVQAAPISVNS